METNIRTELEKEIVSLRRQLEITNNGVVATLNLSNKNTLIIKEAIDNANTTKSVDERIKFLANGLQKVVTHSENFCSDLKESVLRLEDKIEYLINFLERVDHEDSDSLD